MSYTKPEPNKYPRSQEAALTRAEETKIQVISAFGPGHVLALQAKHLSEDIEAEMKRRKELGLNPE